MKASLTWLKEFVDFSLTAEELSHLLTMVGLEVEETESVGDDIVYEIAVTPNRPDCLSIRGIAREIAASLNLLLKNVRANFKEEGVGPRIEVREPSLCRRYVSRIIYGVRPGHSPEWIRKRLKTHGIRTTNNIVDITNYVLMEFGQPLHAFDLDKLSGKKIVVKSAGDVSGFKTLDSKDRSLKSEMLLIWDADKPVAIAGVMGGFNSEVGSSTVNILLECAHFNPVSIRRTSKGLSISTESSYRFERGTDINALGDALDRAVGMITEVAGGSVTPMTDIYPERYIPEHIRITQQKVRSLLGLAIDEKTSVKILSGLGCAVRSEGDHLIVTPPSFRQDIQQDVDLIEEIARVYGYDKIPVTLPSIKMQPSSLRDYHKMTDRVKELMVRAGSSEAINLSFMNQTALDQLQIPQDDRRRDLVLIKNPLRKEDTALRTMLLPALLGNVQLNISRGEKDLSLFEVSKVFFHTEPKLPEEVLQMAAVYCGKPDRTLWMSRHDSFYVMKGTLESLLEGLGIGQYTVSSDKPYTEPYLHPGKSCSVLLERIRVGSLGTIHPETAHRLDLPEDLVLLEIQNLAHLFTEASKDATFKPMPRYPYVERDLAVVVAKGMTSAEVQDAILNIDTDIVESVRLFDIYTGKPIAADKKSMAFSIRYRAADRTLTDGEVDQVHSVIVAKLAEVLRAELRG